METTRVRHPRQKHYDQVISCSASAEEVVKVDALADARKTSRSKVVGEALRQYLAALAATTPTTPETV